MKQLLTSIHKFIIRLKVSVNGCDYKETQNDQSDQSEINIPYDVTPYSMAVVKVLLQTF